MKIVKLIRVVTFLLGAWNILVAGALFNIGWVFLPTIMVLGGIYAMAAALR